MAAIDKGLDFCGTEFIASDGQNGTIVNEDDGSVHGNTDSEGEHDIPYENPQTGQRSRKRLHSPSTPINEPSKRARIPGGRPAVNKPVTADYDTDDNRIKELKHQGYTNREVANKLIEEERVRYVPATVASRWIRIRKIEEKKEEERLDDELSDWHVGEDDILEESFKAVEERFQQEVQKLEEKKWKDVSLTVASLLKGKKKYTAKACKQRWDGLQDGTALKPIEIDPDQERRQKLRETRVAEARRRRAEEEEEAVRARQAAEEEKTAKRQQKQQKLQSRLNDQQAREAEKAEDRRIRAEWKAGKEQKRLAKQEAVRSWNAETEEKRRIRELEERMYRSLTGRTLNRIRRVSNKNFVNDYETGMDGCDHDADDEEDSYALGGKKVDPNSKLEDQDSHAYEDEAYLSNVEDGPSHKGHPLRAKVTLETLRNPRSIMNDDEIKILLHERGLPRRGDDETHPQVVARLAAADHELSRTSLDDLLGKHFCTTRGNMISKTLRLQELDAKKCAVGIQGVKSTDLEFKKGYEGYEGRFSSFIHKDSVEG